MQGANDSAGVRRDVTQILISRVPYPHFDSHDPCLLQAGSATACLIVRERFPDKHKSRYATAFFVTRSLLLTAGHNVLLSKGALEIVDFRITYAGWKEVTASTNTLDCTLVANLYKERTPEWQGSTPDIAVLDCQSHTAETHMTLSLDAAALQPGIFVDVVGYPQQLKDEQKRSLRVHKGLTERKLEDAGKMLPACTLTVTRGQINSRGNGVFEYNISTVPGMSGACVVFDGRVYGTSEISCICLILGIHLGQQGDLNHALSFEAPDVRKFLQEYIIETYITQEDFVEVRQATGA